MKKLLLLTKTLLAAALLCVGQNAWATDVPYNVGSSTSDAWGTAFSDVWTMTGDGVVTVTFTNHCLTDGDNWDNWQLLCDNVALRRLFPDRTVMGFQWFKNNEAIPGATIDDYAERNELCGVFQLRVTLDHEEVIWSNIIEIVDSIEEIPIRVRIYNSRGEEVDENQVTHGFYLYRYEQGEHCWTQKRLIL